MTTNARRWLGSGMPCMGPPRVLVASDLGNGKIMIEIDGVWRLRI